MELGLGIYDKKDSLLSFFKKNNNYKDNTTQKKMILEIKGKI